MKQKDIALLIVIAAVAGMFSLVLSHVIFSSAGARQQSVETAAPITTTFTPPSTAYFNSNSIDPTQIIQIGGSQNPTPFHADNGQ